MRSEKFFCKRCKRFFNDAKIYEEKHGFTLPPYERLAVCPICEGDDFLKFDYYIEKIEVVEKLLPIIMQLNRHINALENIFGDRISNSDLSDSLEMIVELVNEMFDFLDINMQKRILKMDTNSEMERIFKYLKGGL